MEKKLKIVALTLLLTVMAIPTLAQDDSSGHLPDYNNETFHFGFLLGFNEMTYALNTVKDYQNIAQPADSWPSGPYSPMHTQCLYVQNIEPMLAPGLTLGLTCNLRLSNHLDLRFIPSMSFGERHMQYNIGVQDVDGSITTNSFTKKIYTTFIEFPFNLKYRILRYNNAGPYLIGGINPRIDLASQKAAKEQDFYGNIYINNFVTKRFDCAAEFGVGLDLYTKWIKLGIEVKMSEGLMDIVKAPALIYTAPINKLRNRTFYVSLLFE